MQTMHAKWDGIKTDRGLITNEYSFYFSSDFNELNITKRMMGNTHIETLHKCLVQMKI